MIINGTWPEGTTPMKERGPQRLRGSIHSWGPKSKDEFSQTENKELAGVLGKLK